MYLHSYLFIAQSEDDRLNLQYLTFMQVKYVLMKSDEMFVLQITQMIATLTF